MNIEKLSVPLSIVIAGALIAVAFYYSNIQNGKDAAKVPTAPIQNSGGEDMRPITEADHILGNPNAELMFVE